MELKILGGFTVPAGLSCSNVYITTLKANDPDKKLFALATAAQVAKLPVILHITDDPAMTAFPGRCSLMSLTAGSTS
jgi:hypothetical protein